MAPTFLAYGKDNTFLGEFFTLQEADEAVKDQPSYCVVQTNPQRTIRHVFRVSRPVYFSPAYFARDYFGAMGGQHIA